LINVDICLFHGNKHPAPLSKVKSEAAKKAKSDAVEVFHIFLR